MKIVNLVLTLSLLTYQLFASSHFEACDTPWGADGELLYIKREKTESEKPRLSRGQKTCREMIHFFQVYISPIDGPRSSFYPTSSQYTLDAIQKYGVFKGIAMGCDRLMRENGEPWVYEQTDQYGITRKLDHVR